MNLENFINSEVKKVIKKYKISAKEAENIFKKNISAELINNIDKPSVQKQFIKKCRKQIYNQLRQFKKEDLTTLSSIEDIIKNHISTKERYLDSEFFTKFNKESKNYKTVLDMGCGVFPLSIDTTQFAKYIAIDTDKQSIEILKQNNIEADQMGLTQFNKINHETFDICIMLKFVPLFLRQNIEYKNEIKKTKAKHFLISIAKESLTKKESIVNSEKRYLKKIMHTIPDPWYESQNEIYYLFSPEKYFI
jgi:protein-tyrosine-phosphatase